MVELPEIYTISHQINDTMIGKTIKNVITNALPSHFKWYTGNPYEYHEKLVGKTITAAYPGTKYTDGGYIEIECEDVLLAICTPTRYFEDESHLSIRHHLLVEFTDSTYMACTIQMRGAMYCHKIINGSVLEYTKHYTPLDKDFDMEYFLNILKDLPSNATVKGLLTTEQNISGLGNGTAQDIMFNAKLHPRTKLSQLTVNEIEALYNSIKDTIHTMTVYGGRDTECDLFARRGGYKTILSIRALKEPCPVCGGNKDSETYLGGMIYYCPVCQIKRDYGKQYKRNGTAI